jgi:uncharacterized protein (TIGR00369 family)
MSRFAGLEPVPALAPDLLDRLRTRLASSPALQWLQPTLDELELDYCVLGLRYRPELTNGSATIHGGVLATLADTAVAFALSTNFDGKMGFATADMTMHFRRRAKSDVRARARIVKKGRRINVGEVDLVDVEDLSVARVLTSFLLTTSSFDYLPGRAQ